MSTLLFDLEADENSLFLRLVSPALVFWLLPLANFLETEASMSTVGFSLIRSPAYAKTAKTKIDDVLFPRHDEHFRALSAQRYQFQVRDEVRGRR